MSVAASRLRMSAQPIKRLRRKRKWASAAKAGHASHLGKKLSVVGTSLFGLSWGPVGNPRDRLGL
ncbi:hypothetical protein BRAS3843_1390060 [Bradyrhizobium sp. STM 3843]|nr:hypothetical protein BRAS3843_1390060 [Bradyrhizobium sp. STM 3843]